MWSGAFPACFLICLALAGCGGPRPAVVLELFEVGQGAERELAYVRLQSPLSDRTADPDAVARGMLGAGCVPAILHSTSWRWEKDGTLVLTYLAYLEDAACLGPNPSRMPWAELLPPQSTDPKKPRPAVIREIDVLAHGLRHLTFLVRRSSDRRLAEALSPGSRSFFAKMCGQLAGRLETAREFEDCLPDAKPK